MNPKLMQWTLVSSFADESESEEEEEDPEELVMIDESDNEGGNISEMDTKPKV